MSKKNITIDDLARMVQKGFDETAKAKEVNLRFREIDNHFNKMDDRFNKIEKLILVNHE